MKSFVAGGYFPFHRSITESKGGAQHQLDTAFGTAVPPKSHFFINPEAQHETQVFFIPSFLVPGRVATNHSKVEALTNLTAVATESSRLTP